jgi:hypothetical protein
MNPYLERDDVWHDFHERFIPVAAEEIGRQVRPAYIVKIDQNAYVHELSSGQHGLLGRPDIYLLGQDEQSHQHRPSISATLAAPTQAQLLPLIIAERDGFIEIRDGSNRTLITAIELLSPSNKTPGSDRTQYLAKRNRYLETGIHLVEIDLLRDGRRLPLDPPPNCDYCVVVSRAEDRPSVGVWPIKLRDALPIIPIPLRGQDAAAKLDLQAVLHRVYDAAGYADYLYESPPVPPLSADNQKWASGLLTAV